LKVVTKYDIINTNKNITNKNLNAMNNVSPKLNKNSHYNPLELPRYYPGYSPSFVEEAINFFDINNTNVVLDPWAGVGTTGWIAQKKGIKTVLSDINPVMNIYNAACDISLSNYKNKQLIIETLNYLKDNLINSPKCSHLPKWAPKNLFNYSINLIKLLNSIGLFNRTGKINNHYAIIITAVFLMLKEFVSTEQTSNPTYYKIINYVNKKDLNYKLFFNHLTEKVNILLELLTRNDIKDKPKLNIYNCNSSKLIFKNNKFDYIITSPPYCTRIDYAKLTNIELMSLDLAGIFNYNHIRRSTMGTTTVNNEVDEINNKWGTTCKQLLNAIYKHKSHGSKNYYFKNYIQYFNDAFNSLIQINRCLKDNAKGMIVVQNSYYKEHEVKLSKIYIEMLNSLNIQANVLSSFSVKQVISNTQKNYYNRKYNEDIILLSKGDN